MLGCNVTYASDKSADLRTNEEMRLRLLRLADSLSPASDESQQEPRYCRQMAASYKTLYINWVLE